MLDLRGSFLSGIPAQKEYRTYWEFIKVIDEAIKGRKVLQLLYHPRDQPPSLVKEIKDDLGKSVRSYGKR